MNVSRLFALSSVVGLVGVVGCSDAIQAANPFPEKQARCDFRPEKPQCTDWRKFQGPSMATMQGVCSATPNASYNEGSTCPVEDMLGGCQTESGDGTLQTNWFYKSDDYKEVADVQKKCTDDKTTFVNPS
ncbi:MAG: hypothetical protein KIT84_07940 [Labilithrix sp.]|nr:hypothetical protein [Labilithrix sp.]MCW5810928.1 hypothetical protein [Labilithrix sp.]